MVEELIIEIAGGFKKNGRLAEYTIHYCGPDKRSQNNDVLCSTISLQAEFTYTATKSYKITKWLPEGKHTYFVDSYSKEKVDHRLHSIAKQFAKLYLRDAVPNNLQSKVKIVDNSHFITPHNF